MSEFTGIILLIGFVGTMNMVVTGIWGSIIITEIKRRI